MSDEKKVAQKIVNRWWDGEVGDEPEIVEEITAALAQARQEGQEEGKREDIEIGAVGNAKISFRMHIKELEAENARLREALRPVESDEKEAREIAEISNYKFFAVEKPEACCAHYPIANDGSGICGNCRKENDIKSKILALCARIRADQDAKSREEERERSRNLEIVIHQMYECKYEPDKILCLYEHALPLKRREEIKAAIRGQEPKEGDNEQSGK